MMSSGTAGTEINGCIKETVSSLSTYSSKSRFGTAGTISNMSASTVHDLESPTVESSATSLPTGFASGKDSSSSFSILLILSATNGVPVVVVDVVVDVRITFWDTLFCRKNWFLFRVLVEIRLESLFFKGSGSGSGSGIGIL